MPGSPRSNGLEWSAQDYPPLMVAAVAMLLAAPALAGDYHAIYIFKPSSADGNTPNGSLAMDAQGRLYGTTTYGGVYGGGTVYRLTRAASGKGLWTEDILHNFSGGPADGRAPYAPVTLGSDGVIYGTAPYGGSHKRGVVFSLQNAPDGAYKILHNFTYEDGANPFSGVVFGVDGLLYGTTAEAPGKTYRDQGTIYSVSPSGDTTEYAVLHAFGRPGDGVDPQGVAAISPTRFYSLVGTTAFGPGTGPNRGTVFALQTKPGGYVGEKPLYTFGPSPDVGSPLSAPVVGTYILRNTMYGCGVYGGVHEAGGVYQLAPSGNGAFAETVISDFGAQPTDPAIGSFTACYVAQALGVSGKLYGITDGGGGNVEQGLSGGTFFELDPPATAGGTWTQKTDVAFDFSNPGGYIPITTPLQRGGLFYGTTEANTVYELTP